MVADYDASRDWVVTFWFQSDRPAGRLCSLLRDREGDWGRRVPAVTQLCKSENHLHCIPIRPIIVAQIGRYVNQLVVIVGHIDAVLGTGLPGIAAVMKSPSKLILLAIAFGKCVTDESVVLMTVTYLGRGGSDLCSQLRIGPRRLVNGDEIQLVDCV